MPPWRNSLERLGKSLGENEKLRRQKKIQKEKWIDFGMWLKRRRKNQRLRQQCQEYQWQEEKVDSGRGRNITKEYQGISPEEKP